MHVSRTNAPFFRPNHEFDRNLHWDERTVHPVAKHEDLTRVYDSSPEHF